MLIFIFYKYASFVKISRTSRVDSEIMENRNKSILLINILLSWFSITLWLLGANVKLEKWAKNTKLFLGDKHFVKQKFCPTKDISVKVSRLTDVELPHVSPGLFTTVLLKHFVWFFLTSKTFLKFCNDFFCQEKLLVAIGKCSKAWSISKQWRGSNT